MAIAKKTDSERKGQIWIGRAEVALGFAVLALSGLLSVLSDSDPVIELKGALGLSPFLLLITGGLLALAGRNVLTTGRYPYLMHLPLFAWLPVVVFALA